MQTKLSRKKRIGALRGTFFNKRYNKKKFESLLRSTATCYFKVRQLILLQTETGFTRQSAEIITTCDTKDILNSQV